MKLFLLLFGSLLYSFAFGQNNAALQRYDSLSVQQYGSKYLINGEVFRYSQLGPVLNRFPASSEAYSLHRRYAAKSGLFGLITIGFYIASLTQLNKREGLSYAFFGAGLAFNILSIPIQTKANRQLGKAIWLYNRQLIQ